MRILLAGRMLSPIASMAAKAREITAERLSERLPVENTDDEFGQLATVFNQTFTRLEDSFQRLRRFTDDASHELRTPLTALRSVGEVGLQGNTTLLACREVIGSMREETDRLTKLVDSLLTLSRADSSSYSQNRTTTDLTELAAEVTDCLHVLA
jgi:signal transduction histidine kinase